jgi:subtilisin family serine protease
VPPPPAAARARPPLVVAVLDTGLDFANPALHGRLWTNPGEVPGNRRDDDGDGWVDDVHGVDLVRRGATPRDRNGHGTHVAGIIVRGTPRAVLLMVVRVLDARRRGTEAQLARGIRYALARGARILNVSVNTDTPTPALRSAVAAVQRAGAVLVASAGNDRRNLGRQPSYPVCFPEPAVVGVAAMDAAGHLASYSNRGRCVDVREPGDAILSWAPGGGLVRRSGTSMAAAEFTALLARAAARHPNTGVQAIARRLVRR